MKRHLVFFIKHAVWKGEYNYGKKELVLFPASKELKHYKVVCDFSDGSQSGTECLIETISSNFVCGNGFLYHKY